MDVRALYNTLQDELRTDGAAIEALQAALEEKRELVRLLKKRIDALPPLTRVEDGPRSAPALSLAAAVEEVVQSLAGREFVVGDVGEILRGRIDLGERGNARITTVLARLEERKMLVRTFTGGGNVPNRYRVATPADAARSSTKREDDVDPI